MTAARYFLRGEVDLAEQDRIRSELATHLARSSDLLIDCRDLTFLDSSGVQVLIEARHAVEASGHSMVLENVSGPPLRVLEVLGLTDLLGVERTDDHHAA